MKRGTPRNPKVLHLCSLLKTRVPTAVGYLELLWHFTAEFAPQGDIGKFDDRWIEAALYWTGRTGHLIHCLTIARWLDRHSECRLIVHDWHDHADDAVRKRLSRSGLTFLSLTAKMTVRNTVSDRTLSSRVADNGCLPVPEPVPEPNADAWAGASAERMYGLHPKKKNLVLIPVALLSAVDGKENPQALLAEIEKCHAAWVKTPEWQKENGRYAPKLDEWIADKGFTAWPSGSVAFAPIPIPAYILNPPIEDDYWASAPPIVSASGKVIPVKGREAKA